MTITLHEALVPAAIRTLQSLSAILGKGAAHCEARQIDPAVFLSARIFPDMFPLTKQVQIATDMVKGGAARLAGIEIPKYDDNEASFADLQARIARTVAFLQSIPPEQINGREDATIVLKLPSRELSFEGLAYVNHFVLPNLYFHATTTYNLLRQGGVVLGKADFLGG